MRHNITIKQLIMHTTSSDYLHDLSIDCSRITNNVFASYINIIEQSNWHRLLFWIWRLKAGLARNAASEVATFFVRGVFLLAWSQRLTIFYTVCPLLELYQLQWSNWRPRQPTTRVSRSRLAFWSTFLRTNQGLLVNWTAASVKA